MNFEDTIPIIVLALSLISGILIGLPAGYKILIKLIRDVELALKDGKITQDEFEIIVEDLLSLSAVVGSGLKWLLEKIKRK